MDFLLKAFSWVPGVGEALKMKKIYDKIAKLVAAQKQGKLKEEIMKMSEAEAEKAMRKEAEDQYNEHITPEIREMGIPDVLGNKARTKALDELMKVLKDQYQKAKAKA